MWRIFYVNDKIDLGMKYILSERPMTDSEVSKVMSVRYNEDFFDLGLDLGFGFCIFYHCKSYNTKEEAEEALLRLKGGEGNG